MNEKISEATSLLKKVLFASKNVYKKRKVLK